MTDIKVTELDDSYSTLPPNIFKFYQPQFTTKYASLCFFMFGLILITSGILLYVLQAPNNALIYDYTRCHEHLTGKVCQDEIKSKNKGGDKPCVCKIKILGNNKRLTNNVHVYYKLDKFYQNVRFYADSYDSDQLKGNVDSNTNSCPKLAPKDKRVFPCGLLARSLFNDTFEFNVKSSPIDLVRNPYYHSERFINPTKEPFSSNFIGYKKPGLWSKPIYELDENNQTNNGLRNYNFITWMTVYPFDNTLKYLGKWPFQELDPLTDNIEVSIVYNYNVHSFNGRKSLIFAQPGIFGLRNMFLPSIYFIVGCVTLILSILFFLYYRLYGVNQNGPYAYHFSTQNNTTLSFTDNSSTA